MTFRSFAPSAFLLAFISIGRSYGINVKYRAATSQDMIPIRWALLSNLMNPLFLRSECFLVCEHDNRLIGWAQIRPLGPNTYDKDTFDASPGSQTLEQAVEQQLLDEFEKDPSIKVPSGWASLPWTKEYREMSETVQVRSERRQELLKQTKRNVQELHELASVFVVPEFRRQGVGTELVRTLLQEYQESGYNTNDLYLLTIQTRMNWYRAQFGFQAVPDSKSIPEAMQFEVFVGNIITKLLNNQLVCMRGVSEL